MIKLVLIFFLLLTYSFSKFVTNDEIDFSKPVLQIGTYKGKLFIEYTDAIYDGSFDLCYEKTRNNEYYVLYVVNIDNGNKDNITKKLKKRYTDAYFVSMLSCDTDYVEKIIKKRKPVKQKEKQIKNKIPRISDYKIALNYFHSQNYQVSYSMFKKLFKKDYKNLNLNFYLARSAFEIGNYDEALNAYDRFLIQKPNNTRVQLEVAKTFYYQKDYKKSELLFIKIKNKKIPRIVNDNINRYLALIEVKKKKSFFNGAIILGAGYDSNINNRADSDEFYIPKFSTLFTNTTDNVASIFGQASVFFNYRYKYNSKIDLKNNILLFGKDVFKDSQKNVIFLSYNPTLSYLYSNSLSVDYSLFTDFMMFESKYYMNSYGIYPKLAYIYSKDTILNLSFKYQNKINKVSNNANKDSIYTKTNLSILKIRDKYTSINTSIFLEQDRKKSGQLTNIDYDLLGFSFETSYKYNNLISILPTFTYKNKSYLDKNSFYLVKQKNNEYSLGLGALYIINVDWVSQLNYTYSNIKSNIVSADYTKNIISINFINKF